MPIRAFVLVVLLSPLLLGSFVSPGPAQLVTAAESAPPPASPAVRGVWVWGDADDIVRNHSQQDSFFLFANAPQGNGAARINRVFLYADKLNFSGSADKTALRAFIARAHTAGMTVEFLTGEPTWTLNSDGVSSAMRRVDRAIAFNKETPNAQQRFDGIHFTILPYQLSEWNKGKGGSDGYNDKMEKNYMKILHSTRVKISASEQNLTLSVDIPTWFLAKATDIAKPLTASDTPVSYITILNSFDNEAEFVNGYGADNSSGGVGPNLKLAKNVPLVFGADSFDDIGTMEKSFASANAKFSGAHRYMGTAVHHYEKYRKMKAPKPVVAVTPVVAAPAPTPVPAPQPIVAPPIAAVVTQPVVTIPPSSDITANSRGMWVWSSAGTIVRDASAQDEFFDFLSAPHQKKSARINRVFLSGDTFNYSKASDVAKLRAFLKRAHEKGVAVEYLTGKATWVRTAEMHNVATRVDKIIAFNAGTSDVSQRFDGLHLDNEPYLLSEWKSGPTGADGYNDELEKNYVDILRNARAKVDASGQKMTVSTDIPTWFSSSVSEIWKPLTASDTPVSYLTIMNYFDTAEEFMYGYGATNKKGGIGPNIAASGSVPIMFGAETKTDLDAEVTFGNKGLDVLESAFDSARAKFHNAKNFGGVAVHHYDVYRNMK